MLFRGAWGGKGTRDLAGNGVQIYSSHTNPEKKVFFWGFLGFEIFLFFFFWFGFPEPF
jgi:hypothetical protein